ncbi:MAG: response regulator transcription factor [Myxococcota bacterium]|nr:response regulator transcription factor [Myxococcales bacterium]
MRILYVEDDVEARSFVRGALEENGIDVDVASDGPSGLARALEGDYDVAILDVMLPGISGFDILERMRAAHVDTPVLFLTAQGEVAHRIEGLNLGADDYLSKPFAFAELLARVQAVARRRGGAARAQEVVVANLKVDPERRAVFRDDLRIELTPKEFRLLEYLARNTGSVVSRAMITEKVWGHGFESYSNAIDVHVNHLRRKVDRDYEPKLIHTVKGVGYILEDRSGEALAADVAASAGAAASASRG